MTNGLPPMTYNEYDRLEDLPEGPALLKFQPFLELRCDTIYWLPMFNRKILCIRGIRHGTGEEVFIDTRVPYKHLAQRWLEEAMAALSAHQLWVTPEDLTAQWERLK